MHVILQLPWKLSQYVTIPKHLLGNSTKYLNDIQAFCATSTKCINYIQVFNIYLQPWCMKVQDCCKNKQKNKKKRKKAQGWVVFLGHLCSSTNAVHSLGLPIGALIGK